MRQIIVIGLFTLLLLTTACAPYRADFPLWDEAPPFNYGYLYPYDYGFDPWNEDFYAYEFEGYRDHDRDHGKGREEHRIENHVHEPRGGHGHR